MSIKNFSSDKFTEVSIKFIRLIVNIFKDNVSSTKIFHYFYFSHHKYDDFTSQILFVVSSHHHLHPGDKTHRMFEDPVITNLSTPPLLLSDLHLYDTSSQRIR